VIVNTSRELLEKVVQVAGGKIYARRTKGKPHHSAIYAWQKTGKEAVEFLKVLLDSGLLIVKKGRVAAIVSGDNQSGVWAPLRGRA